MRVSDQVGCNEIPNKIGGVGLCRDVGKLETGERACGEDKLRAGAIDLICRNVGAVPIRLGDGNIATVGVGRRGRKNRRRNIPLGFLGLFGTGVRQMLFDDVDDGS